MYLLEIGGEIFPVIILVLTVGKFVLYKYLYQNFIAFKLNKFEELPEDIPPDLLNLRSGIFDLARSKIFHVCNILKVDSSYISENSYATLIGIGHN